MSADVEVVGGRKTYGGVVAVDDVDLRVGDGEFFTLLGPSGSGKTTTLRMIAGFERPDAGTIRLGGEDITGRPPYSRDVNTVFQDYALFPHMTVAENVGYGLRVKGTKRADRKSQVDDVLKTVRLDGYGDRKPVQLSGGQRQRVALARAIVNRPKVLLLDEPLGALDLKLRHEMQRFLKGLQRTLGMTFIYVTHDQEEALTMSDHVAVFNEGRIEQVGTPEDVYQRPATEFVADFVGTSNILDRNGERVCVRPERISFAADGVPATIGEIVFVGSFTRYTVTTDQGEEIVVVRQAGEVSARARQDRAPRLAGRGRVQDPATVNPPTGGRDMTRRAWAVLALITAGLAFPAAGVTKPTAGTLNMIAWEGYTQPQWVKPFETSSGCKVNAKYAGSSDEMVTLMRSGGGGQYDMVSASGDASLRLIYGRTCRPSTRPRSRTSRTSCKTFQSPPNNTVDGKHYGISLQWGPNTLLYNTKKVTPAPTSWAAIYDAKYKGLVTVPDNPIQIADAALYLMKTKPALGITDPYELNADQFDAAIALLKQQKPLIKKYWALASDEIDLFKNGDAVIGASWPYQTNTLIRPRRPR